MKLSEVMQIICKQLDNNFTLNIEERELLLSIGVSPNAVGGGIVTNAIEKTLHCISKSSNKYLVNISMESFNVFNTVQNTIFLYWLSHESFLKGHHELASKVYYLNKMLNCVELFYEINLPSIWSCEHPLGSVMGRAHYSDYFFFMQGCTVGGNYESYPVISENVTMLSNSKIIGKTKIGNHCVIAANTYIKNEENIPDYSIVFGQSPNLIIKPLKDLKGNLNIWRK